MLTNALSKDYNTEEAGTEEVEKQSYYGRCVFEAGNDVVDNQVVVLEWEDMVENTETKPNGEEHANGTGPRHIAGSKIATLTMIAHSESICDRFTKIYGSDGEITADSHQIRVYDFKTSTSKIYKPHEHMDETGGHGGGDVGLAMAFVEAVREVLERETRDNRKEVVKDAQRKWIRCTPEEAVLSHAVVFAAEEARVGRKVVEVDEWAEKNQVDTVW